MAELGPSNSAAESYATAEKESCPVCEEIAVLEDKYDADVCDSCNMFFEECVKITLLSGCDNLGICAVASANLRNCLFCWMSKCYCVGMDSTMVTLDESYYTRRERKRNRPAPPIPSPFGLSWECAQYLDCLLYMEQHYYHWLSLSPEYQILTDENKTLLRKKSFYRGTALQLMERSMFAHDVLWLHNCFWDPFSCDIPPIRSSSVLILNFVIDCRDFNINQDQFQFLKVKLALKDDVVMEGGDNIPVELYERIDIIEADLKLRHKDGDIHLRNEEDINFISQSRLFEYAVFPDRYEFPGHTILLSHGQEQEERLHRLQRREEEEKEQEERLIHLQLREEEEREQERSRRLQQTEQEERVHRLQRREEEEKEQEERLIRLLQREEEEEREQERLRRLQLMEQEERLRRLQRREEEEEKEQEERLIRLQLREEEEEREQERLLRLQLTEEEKRLHRLQLREEEEEEREQSEKQIYEQQEKLQENNGKQIDQCEQENVAGNFQEYKQEACTSEFYEEQVLAEITAGEHNKEQYCRQQGTLKDEEQ